MANQHVVPESVVRLRSRVEGCMRLGEKTVAVLEHSLTSSAPERQIVRDIAGLIGDLNIARGDSFEQKKDALIEAVTALWSHRFDFPATARPFPMFEPALQAMQYIDRDPPQRSGNTESSGRRPRKTKSEYSNESTYIAGQLDASLASLIDASLLRAVRLALDTSAEWIELARMAGFDDSVELAAIERFSWLVDLEDAGLKCPAARTAARAAEKLDVIIELACHLKTERRT